MPKYIGITLGPIYETMQLTSTPAGLWSASYIFSYIAKNICIKLLNKIPCDNFLIPYISKEGINIEKNEQVGMYPDRIIFKSDNVIDIKKVKEIINSVKEDFVGKFIGKITDEKEKENVKNYLENYFQIYAIEKEIDEKENPILFLSSYLDAIENQKNFFYEENKSSYTGNPFVEFFDSRDDNNGKNKKIKNSFLVENIKEWLIDDNNKIEKWILLDDNDNIKNIEDIAKNGPELEYKYQNYYAIVYADADNMTATLKTLNEQKKIRDFSEHCFEYIEESVKTLNEQNKIREFSECCFKYIHDSVTEIIKYGAVPIYAGGDDLLFIAPLKGKEENDFIFSLLSRIEEKFNEKMKNYLINGTSISFGVSINYKKYPLYEALKKASSQLFGVSKGVEGKNATSIYLQKHSGKNIDLIFKKLEGNKKPEDSKKPEDNKKYKPIIELLNLQLEIKETNDGNYFLNSVRQKIVNFKQLFISAIELNDKEKVKKAIENLFENLFKDVYENENKDYIQKKYIEKVIELFVYIYDGKYIVNEKGDKCTENVEENINVLDSCLRMIKFYSEEGNE